MLIANLDYVSHVEIEKDNILKIIMQTHNTFGQFNTKYRYVFIYKKEDDFFHYEKCNHLAKENIDENDIKNHKRVTDQLLQRLPNDVRRQYRLKFLFK